MALTLNQIKNRIQTLALSHYQINNFYFGDPHEFEFNGEVQYPACFCEELAGVNDRSEKLKRYNFRIYFLDLVGVSTETEVNETEVLSDMSSVCADMLAMLMSTVYQDDWLITEVNSEIPVTEFMEDMVAGRYLEVGISVDFLADSCQVPQSTVTFNEDFDMARTKILTYTGTGAEGESFSPTGLAGKNVLSVYRAGTYRRVLTTTPTDFDTIQVVGTDLGSYKGILSTTGAVGLSSGDLLVNGEILDFLIYA